MPGRDFKKERKRKLPIGFWNTFYFFFTFNDYLKLFITLGPCTKLSFHDVIFQPCTLNSWGTNYDFAFFPRGKYWVDHGQAGSVEACHSKGGGIKSRSSYFFCLFVVLIQLETILSAHRTSTVNAFIFRI